jgi:hypothetical protein
MFSRKEKQLKCLNLKIMKSKLLVCILRMHEILHNYVFYDPVKVHNFRKYLAAKITEFLELNISVKPQIFQHIKRR